jgi:HSP20 family protein
MAMSKASASLLFLRYPQGARERDLASEANWSPNTDVYATDQGLVVKVELAGMRREDLELTVEGRLLKISGQRPDGCRTTKCTFLAMDINYGAFERVIELPRGYDLRRAQAAYQNGFLRIDVPVQARSSKKRVTVSSLSVDE